MDSKAVERPVRGVRLAVVDSGLGGLTVLAALRRRLPAVAMTYLADSAAFPYGGLSPQAVQERVLAVVGALVAREKPDVVVIACNTATTAGLGLLRAAFPQIEFIGTVPAVERAAQATRSGVIGLLATPATVNRPMIDHLSHRFARQCVLVRVGSEKLAALAEGKLRGAPPSTEEVRNQIAPLFDHDALDVVILGCTHYPLLLKELKAAAPRPVLWMDAAEAVAAQAVTTIGRVIGDSPWQAGADNTLVTVPMPGDDAAFAHAGLPSPEVLVLGAPRSTGAAPCVLS
ncbi:MAG: glutamate racemase [Rhodospirillaceae bacterium]